MEKEKNIVQKYKLLFSNEMKVPIKKEDFLSVKHVLYILKRSNKIHMVTIFFFLFSFFFFLIPSSFNDWFKWEFSILLVHHFAFTCYIFDIIIMQKHYAKADFETKHELVIFTHQNDEDIAFQFSEQYLRKLNSEDLIFWLANL